MCGIVGARDSWLRRRGLDPESAMRAAIDRLRWRGRDGIGLCRLGDWWLGCARLAITQPRSRQPVVRRGGRFAGVLNGAITNARELWLRRAPAAATCAQLPNDAWLPLLAVADNDAVTWHGHHAAAVVDAGSDSLRLFVDAAGEKPLLVVREDRGPVAFASTWPGLAALGQAPPAVDAAAFLRAGYAEVEDLRPAAAKVEPAAGGAGLAERLRTAVRRCADSTVPVALSLSGGIDSSCLAASLAAVDRAVPCYQFTARGEPPQERRMASAVAAHCRLPFVAVDGGPEVLDALPQLTAMHGLPLGDPSVLAVHALAQAAARDGVRVLLSGEGADELLLGYRRHHAMTWLRRRRSVPAWLLARWSMWATARLLRAVAAADAYGELLAATPPGFAAAVLAPELSARPPRPPCVPARDLEAVRRHDLEHYLRGDLLPKLDVATMAAGVEGRCPYLDRDVAAFALGQPAASLLGKRPLRQAFAGSLPAAVFRQPKRGFLLPLDRWFRGELPLLDLLAEPRTQQRPHLRPGGIAAVVARHRRGRSDLGRGLYLLAAYELFLRAQEAQR